MIECRENDDEDDQQKEVGRTAQITAAVMTFDRACFYQKQVQKW